MITVLGYGLIGGLLSLLGGILLVSSSDRISRFITPFVGFGAGAFLAVSFLDLLPESIEVLGEPHVAFNYFLLGFTLFFLLERVVMKYAHTHSNEVAHHEHTESLPWLVILGDSIHNFIDGVVIALSYIANPALGLTTTLAVAAHEIPQEIGDFAILLDCGWSKQKIIMVNILSSLLTILGVLLGYTIGHSFDGILPYMAAVVAGIFTYIAASDLIPEINDRAGHRIMFGVVCAFVFGLGMVGYLIGLTHGEEPRTEGELSWKSDTAPFL